MTNKQIYQTIHEPPRMLKGHARDPETASENYSVAQAAMKLLADVTPRMLLQVFPVTKTYDGDKWQSKDYFFTMRALEEYGLDKPLGENVFHVLWDYMNPHVSDFMVWHMEALSDVRVAQGGKDPLVEWMEEQGVPSYSKGVDSLGREVMVNNMTGEVQIVTKPKPRWYRKLKGGCA